MRRHIVYPGQIPLDTDMLNTSKNAYYGLGWLAESTIGTVTTVSGLTVTPTIPASLQVNVAPGAIYSLQTVDSSAYGSLGTDSNQFVKQGIVGSTQTLTITPPATVGQSQNYLVQVAFAEVDAVPIALPYYNAADPSVAWSGPNNSGTQQNTQRQDNCIVGLKAGAPAPTGSQTTPAPDVGYTGIYVITCAQGQTTITAGNISVLPSAPYFPTLPQVPIAIQTGQWNYAVAGGTANALTATFFPAIASNAAGVAVALKITTANTGAATFNAGPGALPIQTKNGAAIAAGDLPLNAIIDLECNGTAWQLLSIAYSEVPQISYSNAPIYVRTDGNDSNTGKTNTAGGAFLTIAAAITNGIGARALIPGQTAIIQLGIAGTYAAPGTLPASFTPIQILGDIANQGNYIISGAGPLAGGVGVIGLTIGQLTLSGVTLQNTGTINHSLVSSNNSYIRCEFTTFLTSLTTTFALAFAPTGGNIRFDSGCIWQASAGYMWYASGGTITMGANQALASTPSFTVATVLADNGGRVLRGSAGVTFTGTGAVGTRYSASLNSVINMLFGGANFIPGNVAGTTATGGQYQ